ncbi:MAG: SMP-30/gluconolactonase/LRE family protein [Acidimicrobiia bacterium]
MTEVREVATGLQFPEGPIWMPDGSVILVEIRRGTLSRVTTDGKVDVVADLGGGPNGAAIGPDGAVYVCNNGGFLWSEIGDMIVPMDIKDFCNEPPNFEGGWIDRVDLSTGEHTVLYRECDGHAFRSPNDIVFDADGGFWFTDLGKTRARAIDRGGLYYARPDGSSVIEAAYGLFGANGVGLSPGGDRVYVAESFTGRLIAWDLSGPGRVAAGSRCVVATKGHFDSLAVEEDGSVAVAAIGHGVCVVRPDETYEYVDMPDPFTTNVCFGDDNRRTAFVTLSGGGRLIAADWPRPGLKLEY